MSRFFLFITTPNPVVFLWVFVMFYAILISVAIGFGGGWLVKDWKDGAQIALIKSEKQSLKERTDTLVASNNRCATDIESVRQGLAGIQKAADDRIKAAEAEMTKAQKTASWHVNRAAEIRNGLPPKPNETQCQAVEREQLEYVASRRVSE